MSEIYRDRSDGTAARRQELLRRRRDELVTMPHAVRRVVVARSARIAASEIAAVVGVGLIAASWSPQVAARIASSMPGVQPAPLSTLLFGAWLLGVVAWAISRGRVEHRFAVAMSKYVLPSSDVDDDVERLDHEHPDAIARAMGHRLEVGSAAWPILAAALVLPATALWLSWMARGVGWPVSEFDESVGAHTRALAAIALTGAVAAIALTRKAMRQPIAGTLSRSLGVVTTVFALMAIREHTDLGWVLAGVGLTAIGIGVMVRRLAKERALLEIEDPAAGSELFTIRGALRELRAGLAVVRGVLGRVLGRVQRRHWGALAAVAAIAMLATGASLFLEARLEAGSRRLDVPAQQVALAPVAEAPPPPTALDVVAPEPARPSAPYSVERVGARLRIEATFDQRDELVVPLAGNTRLPRDWQATIVVELASDGPIGIVRGDGINVLVANGAHTQVRINGCNGPRPLALRLARGDAAPGTTVILYVTPRLTVGDCPVAVE